MGNAEQNNDLVAAHDLAIRALAIYGFSQAKSALTGRDRLTLVAHWENTVYRFDSDHGAFVLRLHPVHGRTVDTISAELRWLEFLSQKGLRVPRPRLSLDGDCAAWIADEDSAKARICSMLTWMPGEALLASTQNMEKVGGLLASLHRYGNEPLSLFIRPQLDFDWLVGERGGLGYGPNPLDKLPAEYSLNRDLAIPLIAEAFAIIRDQGGEPIPIHGDFHMNNLVFEGGVPTVIDFDDCGMGLPHYDIATVLHLYRESEEWSDLLTALLKGYSSVAPLPVKLLETLDRFMLARRLCMLMWMAAKARVDERMRAQLPNMLNNLKRLLIVML
nr:phosphotransferase [uncultured Rhodoferax sp.]